MSGARPMGGRPWIIAHRGASAHAPEDTLEAARTGHEAGADAWELDEQLSRDVVPVVLHDESRRRTTDAARRFAGDPRERAGFRVADFDLDEIRTPDAGGWFVDPAGPYRSARWFGTLDALSPDERARYASGRVRVPTLAEALDLSAGLGWRVNVGPTPIRPPRTRCFRSIGTTARPIHPGGFCLRRPGGPGREGGYRRS